MSVERTPKLTSLNRNQNEISKQVFKERQPFQVKTPPTATLLQATKLTKTTNMRLFPNENNSAAATSSFKAKVPVNGQHNQQTPKNRNTNNLSSTGSVKQDNSLKKPFGKNISSLVKTNRLTTPVSLAAGQSTPMSRLSHINSSKLLNSVLLSNSKAAKRESNQLNPIINGIDYSDMIARKQELGYTGPGYIISFDCDPKYLVGINVSKGFWKLHSYKTENANNKFKDLGPTTWLTRADTENKTPSKCNLVNFDFQYNPVSITPGNLRTMPSESSDLEPYAHNSETKKPKKHLTWLDVEKKQNLESIVESSSSTPQNDITLMSPNLSSSVYKSSIVREKNRKSLRRSYSHNDLKNIILAQEDEENYDNQVFYDNNVNLNLQDFSVRLNETLELSVPQSSRKINISASQFTSQVKNEAVPIYDLNTSNDSLMNGPMSSSLSQSLDSLKINEVSYLSEDYKFTNPDKIASALQALIDHSEVSALMNGSITKIVANDCNSYMHLSNKLNELNKVSAKLKECLVLKKV